MKIDRIYVWLFLALISSIILAVVSGLFIERNYDKGKIQSEFQQVFLNREIGARETLKDVVSDFRENEKAVLSEAKSIEKYHQLYYDQSEIVLITKVDSIVYLSHNALPVNHFLLPQFMSGMYKLENGWYYMVSKNLDDKTVWVFSLVKKEYHYKNKFLQNDFQKQFKIPDFVSISLDAATEEGYMIYNAKGDYVFSLILPADKVSVFVDSFSLFLSVLFYCVAILIFLITVLKFFAGICDKKNTIIGITGLFLTLLLFRFLIFYFQIPSVFYSGDLFSARHFAASYWLPSLGDLFLNVLFANIFVFFVFIKISQEQIKPARKISVGFILMILMIVFLAFVSMTVLNTLKGLVINSSLNLNVRFIFAPDVYHIIGFFILTGIFVFYYFLGSIILTFIRRLVFFRKEGRYLFFLSWCLAIFLFYFIVSSHFILWMLIFCASLLTLLNQPNTENGFSLARLLFSFFVFSVLSTYGLFSVNQKKELAARQNVSLRIASEQDPVAEFLFLEIEAEILNDFTLAQLVINDPYDDESILNYLKSEYFSDFWAKYDIQITPCFPGELLLIKSFADEMVCDDYFQYYADHFGKPTLSQNFFYLDNNTGRNSYLAIVPIKLPTKDIIPYHLYIEFESRFIPKELGFPELLVDEQIDITRNLGNYSYAIYKSGMMTHKYGSYFFSINVDSYAQGTDEPFVFFETDGYSHLLFNKDADTRIMVSKPEETILENIAPFSYLFVFFLFYAVIIWLISHYILKGINIGFNFKKRLQFSVIGIVLISVVAIGSASAWFIFNIYKNKNEAFINEKAHSILIELESHLAQENYLDMSYQDYLNQLLTSLSNVFFTDINIFNIDGSLLGSSRPKVFIEGLVAPFIHPVAFNNLKISKKSLFIHNERIGNLEYISAYVPLRNANGVLIAYINLPYFAQQSELRNEISYFLVAFINIYLLLLLLSVVIAYFISNHVTRPLQVIRDSISRLSIVSTNEKIKWERNDEIGQLVAEYNRMISELEISAELLARSERESAWREMAKQVAHEIKNPLTPMRLNVQYLQRAWKDRADDWDERLDRFTKTMVEQIDNLSLIAGEFSDFAKMPTANNDIINLSEFIPEIPDLYKGFKKVDISYKIFDNNIPLVVFADRKQLLRVFNNLIKNAMQAYSKNAIARVEIFCKAEENYCNIEIRDFGNGIADDLKKNIFQPYFTTKTAGMGLGLAMVKSIIESFNGHISFESEKGKGTAFIIRIPLLK